MSAKEMGKKNNIKDIITKIAGEEIKRSSGDDEGHI